MNLRIVLTLLSIAGACSADWKHLRIKFDVLLNGFFSIPLTKDELLEGNWKYMTTDSDLNVDFYSYGDDPRVSIGYDTYGNIAGVRVSFVIEDLANRAKENKIPYPVTFTDKPIFSNATYCNTDVYYTTVLFASPGALAAGGRSITNGILAEDVYLKIDGQYRAMPRNESGAPSLGFTKQGCFISMGQHYFFGMTPTADCKDLPGVFLLYDSEELVGLGLIPFGTFTTKERTWFEDPFPLVAKMIAPNSPPCMTEWISNYGTSSIHLFFKEHPRLTFC